MNAVNLDMMKGRMACKVKKCGELQLKVSAN